MKKSIFNIVRKLQDKKNIIFNSYSQAIAFVDDVFFKIYNNLGNFNLTDFNDKEKEIYKQMYDCSFIVNDETDELKNLEYLKFKKITDTAVFNLTIFPTLNCNFDCYYCFQENKRGVISKDVQKKIVELIQYHAERKSNINIIWHGGEPLLVFDIICDLSNKFMDICKNNNVKYSSTIKTNGYLFTDDIIAKLNDLNIFSVQITLDGPPEMHNKRRFLKKNNEGTFEVILENLKKLKSNNIKLEINTNINKEFSLDVILGLVKILKENDLIENFFIAPEEELNFRENKNNTNTKCLTFIEYSKFVFKCYKTFQDLGIKKLEDSFFPTKGSNNICAAKKCSTLLIDPEGFLYKCPLDAGVPEKAIGNILDKNTLNERFLNNIVKYMTWDPFKFSKCINCNLIPICYGGCPRVGIAQDNEPRCVVWKHVIEDLIDAIAVDKLKVKNNFSN